MKYIVFVLFSLSITQLFSQTFEINPPGTIKLNDSLYIDVAPVSNKMYLEFHESTENFWSIKTHEALKKLPSYELDWDIIENKLGYNHNKFTQSKKEEVTFIYIDSTNRYLRHYKYSNYPLISVSKEEAILFCKWRTDMVKLGWAIKSKNEDERKKYPLNIIYRLPTTLEFEEALSLFGYSKSKLKGDDFTPIKPYYKTNHKKFKKAIFFKNNISEYTLDSIPFGRNWKNETTLSEFNNYTGFRCVCEIIN